jgi:RimJ/RimL family protein N-acetyltransferase
MHLFTHYGFLGGTKGMLKIAPIDDYAQLHEICAPLNMHLAVTAILAGETPAQVYVDDLAAPTVALLFPWQGDRVYLAGEPHNEHTLADIKKMLAVRFAPTQQLAEPRIFRMHEVPGSWETHLPSLCDGMETTTANREWYVLSHVVPDWRASLAGAWQLRQIDYDLLADQRLLHLPELVAEIHSESPSPEDFLARKFGFCLLEGLALIGWCLSEYNHADRCEVGIETLPAYRRRGAGFVLASALIEHALAQGITHIGWHCWQNNHPSRSLAIKLGGTLQAEHTVQLCRFM